MNKNPDSSCLYCGKSIRYYKKYCDNKCQSDYQRRKRIDEWDDPKYNTILAWLIEEYGYSCSVCGLTTWNGKNIVLEVEHKDGNSSNNSKDNLCLICPNCHSQTDTYKNRNKGNGRHYRRIRYQEGKSF